MIEFHMFFDLPVSFSVPIKLASLVQFLYRDLKNTLYCNVTGLKGHTPPLLELHLYCMLWIVSIHVVPNASI